MPPAYPHSELTAQILKAFYYVYNTLGHGFLEKVYENALVIALRNMGLQVEQQAPITVYFQGQPVGEYFADLVVEGCVIVEIKAADDICEAHKAQLLNYLRAARIPVGLVLNFGPKPRVSRRVI
jgi:GxxExxY protein